MLDSDADMPNSGEVNSLSKEGAKNNLTSDKLEQKVEELTKNIEQEISMAENQLKQMHDQQHE